MLNFTFSPITHKIICINRLKGGVIIFKEHITIPSEKYLEDPSNWIKINKNQFFALRFNFHIMRRQIDNKIYNGEILQNYYFPLGISQTVETTEILHHITIDLKRSLTRSFCNNQFSVKIGHDLSKFLPSMQITPKIASEIKSSIEQKYLKENSLMNLKYQSVRHVKTNTLSCPADYEMDVNSVIPYVKCQYDIFLAFIDYIFVTCKKTTPAHQRVCKFPDPSSEIFHKNKIVIKSPFVSFQCWEPLYDSKRLVPVENYVNEVRNPYDITLLHGLYNIPHIFIPKYSYAEVPTLYQIARRTFPSKE